MAESELRTDIRDEKRLSRAINRARWRMLAVIRTEGLLVRAAPLLGLIALFVILSWFGYFRAVADWARWATLALLIAGAIASLWPLSRIKTPAKQTIDSRLERQNLITHQAISARDDVLGNDSPFANALWSEHKRRLAGQIEQLSAGAPHTDLPSRDPYGLRVAMTLLLVTAFGYSFSGGSGRLDDAFKSHSLIDIADIRVDAWISPPPYINAAPVFLTGLAHKPDQPANAVAGSEITVRVGAGAQDAILSFANPDGETVMIEPQTTENPTTRSGQTAQASNSSATVYAFKPTTDGVVSVKTASGSHQWPITIIPDLPPVLAFTDKPGRAANGALELAYSVTDDYGVVSARAEIEPVDEPGPNAVPLYDQPEYRLPLPRRGSKDGSVTSSQDLTEHPLAGQQVRITLVGVDGAGQEGRSEAVVTTMPARFFSEPLAAAVVELRSVLALDAHNLPRVFELHDALTIAPEETIPNLTNYLLLQSVKGRIRYAVGEEGLRAAIDYMWSVALQIEDGNLSLAAQRLRDAQNALSEALENGATDEEIAKLMDELREAMKEYLSELARQAPQNQPNAQQNQMAENVLRQRDLENMLDQIENLSRSGARDQARQMLSELQRMMNNLQAGRQQQQQQQSSPMREQMDKLGELMQRQQELMNETFKLQQQQNSQRQQGQQPEGEQGEQQQGENNQGQSLQEMLDALGEQQQALREQLEQLQKELEGMGMQPSEGFGDAGEAMGDATGNLEGGETGSALSDQGRALQALRQGAQQMMNQMMQAMGNQPGSGGQQGMDGRGNPRPDDRDPLGRPRSTNGPDFGNSVKVPDEIDIQRAREILDAIRKRLGDRLSPEVEKQYLERLLDLK